MADEPAQFATGRADVDAMFGENKEAANEAASFDLSASPVTTTNATAARAGSDRGRSGGIPTGGSAKSADSARASNLCWIALNEGLN